MGEISMKDADDILISIGLREGVPEMEGCEPWRLYRTITDETVVFEAVASDSEGDRFHVIFNEDGEGSAMIKTGELHYLCLSSDALDTLANMAEDAKEAEERFWKSTVGRSLCALVRESVDGTTEEKFAAKKQKFLHRYGSKLNQRVLIP